MNYATPELLLVGAAQNLVLLSESDFVPCEQGADLAGTQSDEIELW